MACFNCCTGRTDQAPELASRGAGSDAGSHWITEAEARMILELRAALTEQERVRLAAAPEDIRHDITLCRFLRGHQGVQGALKAVRKHLGYREQFRETLSEARSLLEPGAQDYRASCTLYAEKINPKFAQLQLPPWQGTNTGMPVSLVVLRIFDMNFLGSEPEDELRRWFMSCLEQRSFTLFNQSIAERRMAKVLEARDCLGFSISQLLVSPRILFRLRSVFQDGDVYPELLLRLQVFNLEPGSRAVSLISSLLDEKMKSKVVFGDRGRWQDIIGLPTVLSPVALPAWERHMAEHGGTVRGWRQINASICQQVATHQVQSGTACGWRVRSALDTESVASPSRARGKALIVKVHFFRLQDKLEFAEWRTQEECRLGASDECSGKFVAPGPGVIMIEATLEAGSPSLVVSLTCGPNGADVRRPSFGRRPSLGIRDVPPTFGTKKTGWSFTSVIFALVVVLLAMWIAPSLMNRRLTSGLAAAQPL